MQKESNQLIEQACVEALEKFKKTKKNDYTPIIEKIEFLLGSYRYDRNPVGLYEVAEESLSEFKKMRQKNARSVAKKLVENLNKAISTREALN
ncbi:hypothetical protein [Sediminitomix flava]|uniref:Uncharacterized protein n=1 Tax=Sediminitomix flava TaxID=379075 RepID=A0A315ZEY0_SEDFL|nr:hypothetical protein [Sediminitomix flava]PWJ44146.1 hypothetical protein BC781_101496 [Sediminitomix flava]